MLECAGLGLVVLMRQRVRPWPGSRQNACERARVLGHRRFADNSPKQCPRCRLQQLTGPRHPEHTHFRCSVVLPIRTAAHSSAAPSPSRGTARGETWLGYAFISRDFHPLPTTSSPGAPTFDMCQQTNGLVRSILAYTNAGRTQRVAGTETVTAGRRWPGGQD